MEMALENAYYQIDLNLCTPEAKQKLIEYRAGDTLEEKKLPRYMEEESQIGTAQAVGSTAVTVLIYNEKIYTANLGDSRAVLAIDETKPVRTSKSNEEGKQEPRVIKAEALSDDHKPLNPYEERRISNAGGNVGLDGRINGNLAVARTLGDLQFKANQQLPSHKQMVSNQCQMKVTRLSPKCKFILIACDGIWDCMTNEEAVAFVDQ